MWIKAYDVVSQDSQTKKTKVEKTVTVIHEFNQLEDHSQVWRRTSTVMAPNMTPMTMVIEGSVLDVDDKRLLLSIERSSCDGVDTGFRIEPSADHKNGRYIYYQRFDDKLRLRTKPFPEPKVIRTRGGLNGLFAGMIEAAVTTVVESMLQGMVDGMTEMGAQLFTLVAARDQLKAGSGDYHKADRKMLIEQRFAYGQIGCFGASSGQEFTATGQQILSW